MNKRRVLIALEQLGVGGIETFVLNQVKALKNKNMDVYVIAKKGIYSNQFKQAGAKTIDYTFEDCTYFDLNKVNKMIKILKDNKIDEVHINQFPIMNILMPACILSNTPYVVYLHMASGIINDPVHNAYNYFEKQFVSYNKCFKMLFKYATSIVAITEAIKNHTAERYGIDKKKIIVRPNAIDLSEFTTKKKVTQIKKVFIISRISIEKKNVIINAIKLYKKLKEQDPEITLSIAGDGNLKPDIEEYIKNQKIKDVTMLGNISNVKEVMEKQDLVIAVDRCIMEALCLKKLSVISGYDDMKGLVTKNNLDKCIKENFCGKSLRNRSIEKLAEELLKLNSEKISKIVNDNLKVVKNKLDINKNVFYLDITKVKYNREEFIYDLFELSEILGKSQKDYRERLDQTWYEFKGYEERIKRRYGLFEKIFHILGNILRGIKRLFQKKDANLK